MLVAYLSNAQNISIISKADKDNIELRWIPTNYNTWRYANNTGYKLERVTIIRKNKPVMPPEVKVLNLQPIKLADMAEFEKFSDEKYPAVFAECVYGNEDSIPSGNSPVALYKRYQHEQMKFGFGLFACDMDLQTAKLAGLYYNDVNADNDEKYLYRLTFWQPDSLRCDTAYTFVSLDDYALTYGPNPEVYSDNETVTLYFGTSTCRNFNSFWIERSDDNGATFRRLNTEPLAKNYSSKKSSELYYIDTLVVQGKQYLYRIIGNDSFSKESLPGETAKISVVSKLTNYADFSRCKPVNNNSMELTWYLSDNDNDKVSGFKIYRSSSPDGVKTLVHTTQDLAERTWLDKTAGYDNYYFVSAVTPSEEKLNPFPIYGMLIDSIPPDAPQKPQGFCDSLGHVYLSWVRAGNDVKGFRVFYANNPDHDFLQCSDGMLTDTFYVDTVSLNTLSKKVYYSLVLLIFGIIKVRCPNLRK